MIDVTVEPVLAAMGWSSTRVPQAASTSRHAPMTWTALGRVNRHLLLNPSPSVVGFYAAWSRSCVGP
jgi:hypothetical protein